MNEENRSHSSSSNMVIDSPSLVATKPKSKLFKQHVSKPAHEKPAPVEYPRISLTQVKHFSIFYFTFHIVDQ